MFYGCFWWISGILLASILCWSNRRCEISPPSIIFSWLLDTLRKLLIIAVEILLLSLMISDFLYFFFLCGIFPFVFYIIDIGMAFGPTSSLQCLRSTTDWIHILSCLTSLFFSHAQIQMNIDFCLSTLKWSFLSWTTAWWLPLVSIGVDPSLWINAFSFWVDGFVHIWSTLVFPCSTDPDLSPPPHNE